MFRSFRLAGFAAAALLSFPVSAVAGAREPTAPAPVEATTAPARVRPDHQATAAAPVQATGVTAAASPRRPLAELVTEHAGLQSGDAQFECLASAVYFEARGEPLEGQLAVAEVILNRVRSGRFRGTVCDVVTQPSQFSFVSRGVIPAAPRESAAWARAAAIAHIAMNDLADATGDESLFFHAISVNPRWGRPRLARIGNHIFYR
jgi:N-acetylmuramoyl-L-alanine amidase